MLSGFDRNLSRFRVSGKLERPRLANPCVGATPTVPETVEKRRFFRHRDTFLRWIGLCDLATTTGDEQMREQLVLRGRRIVAGCTTRIDASDFKRLESRLAELGSLAPATMLNAVDGPQAS
jgi:hypothetical protein